MTSLLETADFKAAMETAERGLSSLLCGTGEENGIMTNPHSSSALISLDDELWRELYLLPTPPLSPGCLSSNTDSNSTPDNASEVGDAAGLSYVNMLEYDQMMDVLQEAERVLGDSKQTAYQQDLLLQDCMWSGGNCNDPMLTGTSSTAMTHSNSAASEATRDPPSLENDNDNNQGLNLDDSPTDAEPDCIEPSAVFPVLKNSNDSSKKDSACSQKGSGSSFRTSIKSHTSMSSSDSEEEIDVVTVERTLDHVSNLHGKSVTCKTSGSKKHSSSSSSKLGISGINSPLRKKRHTKRLSRRASEDGMESDEEARRASHNVLERKRRNDLKNSFDILRGGIPELEENVRAPKVVILRKAVEYIQSLQTADQKTKVDYNKEQSRNRKLMERLSQLRSVYAI